MRPDPFRHLLRMAALSAALIAGGAANALADVPGYDFPDEWRAKPAPMQLQAAPPPAMPAQNNCSIADAGTPALAATLGRVAANHVSPGAASARSGG
jgi:hypothetical protein